MRPFIFEVDAGPTGSMNSGYQLELYLLKSRSGIKMPTLIATSQLMRVGKPLRSLLLMGLGGQRVAAQSRTEWISPTEEMKISSGNYLPQALNTIYDGISVQSEVSRLDDAAKLKLKIALDFDVQSPELSTVPLAKKKKLKFRQLRVLEEVSLNIGQWTLLQEDTLDSILGEESKDKNQSIYVFARVVLNANTP